MNPYNTLARVGGVFSMPAELIKKDGARVAIRVKPIERAAEPISGGAMPGVARVRAWSCAANELTLDGAAVKPEAGDALEVTSDGGAAMRYPLTRDATTGRFWEWQYNRPGYRLQFFTKYHPE